MSKVLVIEIDLEKSVMEEHLRSFSLDRDAPKFAVALRALHQVSWSAKGGLMAGGDRVGSWSIEEASPKVRLQEMKKFLDWVRQTLHRTYHPDYPLENCPKDLCDGIIKALKE